MHRGDVATRNRVLGILRGFPRPCASVFYVATFYPVFFPKPDIAFVRDALQFRLFDEKITVTWQLTERRISGLSIERQSRAVCGCLGCHDNADADVC